MIYSNPSENLCTMDQLDAIPKEKFQKCFIQGINGIVDRLF